MSQHDYPERLSKRYKGLEEGGSTMDLLVETLTGTAFEMTVSPSDTIFAIKSKIFRVEGIPVSQQHLLYNLCELDDARSLRDQHVRAGARLRLVLRARAGPVATRRLPPPQDGWPDADSDGSGPAARRVAVLVLREGRRVSLLRVRRNADGTYSPADDDDSPPLSPRLPPPRAVREVPAAATSGAGSGAGSGAAGGAGSGAAGGAGSDAGGGTGSDAGGEAATLERKVAALRVRMRELALRRGREPPEPPAHAPPTPPARTDSAPAPADTAPADTAPADTAPADTQQTLDAAPDTQAASGTDLPPLVCTKRHDTSLLSSTDAQIDSSIDTQRANLITKKRHSLNAQYTPALFDDDFAPPPARGGAARGNEGGAGDGCARLPPIGRTAIEAASSPPARPAPRPPSPLPPLAAPLAAQPAEARCGRCRRRVAGQHACRRGTD